MSVLKMRCKKNLYSQDGQLLLSSGVDYDVTTGSKDYSGLIYTTFGTMIYFEKDTDEHTGNRVQDYFIPLDGKPINQLALMQAELDEQRIPILYYLRTDKFENFSWDKNTNRLVIQLKE